MISTSIRMLRCHGAAARFVPRMWKGIIGGRWMASAAPEWWRKGWPRARVDSMAEAELLSQLAVALKPRTKIGELFRRFPAPEGWGGKYLDPDLAVHGVLKRKDAALFVEYDGFWRHSEGEGLSIDRRKNAALLSHAPLGSLIVRIGHWECKPLDTELQVRWIAVDRWNSGDQKSMSKVLKCIFLEILAEFGERLDLSVAKRLQKLAGMDFRPASARSQEFVNEAAAAAGGSTREELFEILTSHGFSGSSVESLMKTPHLLRLSSETQLKPCLKYLFGLGLSETEITKAAVRYPEILGLSVEGKLKPTVRWLSNVGLSQCQIKGVATSSRILGLSIEQNLKPTVQWLLDLGLTKSQAAKAVATFPQFLGLSVEENLKPTVQWLLDLGLTKSQAGKAVATSPRILGCSIEQNLKPTVQWLLDLGLTKSQAAKAVATFPQFLGLSVEENLKPTVQWLLDLGLTKSQAGKAVATSPRILGYSLEQNLKPTVQWLLDLGLTKSQAGKAVATFPPILGYSLEQNLKPTVQWLLDLGLTKSQAAKVVATFPQFLGLSVEENLKPTVQWLLDLGLTKSQAGKAVATSPRILGYSLEQNLKPTVQWLLDLGLTKSQAAKAVATCPHLMGLSVEENLKPTVQWLRRFGVGKCKLASLVIGWPRFLGYSIAKNLDRKALLLETLCTRKGAREIISKNPEILRYSQQRISTRVSVLSKLGETSRAHQAVTLSDEMFEKTVHVASCSLMSSNGFSQWPRDKKAIVAVCHQLCQRGVNKKSTAGSAGPGNRPPCGCISVWQHVADVNLFLPQACVDHIPI